MRHTSCGSRGTRIQVFVLRGLHLESVRGVHPSLMFARHDTARDGRILREAVRLEPAWVGVWVGRDQTSSAGPGPVTCFRTSFGSPSVTEVFGWVVDGRPSVRRQCIVLVLCLCRGRLIVNVSSPAHEVGGEMDIPRPGSPCCPRLAAILATPPQITSVQLPRRHRGRVSACACSSACFSSSCVAVSHVRAPWRWRREAGSVACRALGSCFYLRRHPCY